MTRHKMYLVFLSAVLPGVASYCCAATNASKPPTTTKKPQLKVQELKTTRTLDIAVSRCTLLLLTQNRVIRTASSDPAIAEPVVVAENQLYILGKKPGIASLQIWDDAGSITALQVRVLKSFPPHGDAHLAPPVAEAKTTALLLEFSSPALRNNQHDFRCSPDAEQSKSTLQAYELRLHPGLDGGVPASFDTVERPRGLSLPSPSILVDLAPSQSKVWHTNIPMSSLYIAAPDLPEPILTAQDEVILLGKRPGETKFAITDRAGHKLIALLRNVSTILRQISRCA